ncbi:hypothetical protein MKW94_013142 [Papaver nudicaule]|uniref:Cation/H+ exchanger domain-containing protein n=1 Tax=Papaver nudicaule TaxID=74823 RepID=A0AA41VCP7_PAPNU|nr:hypothetical protein [Papaver nudicaule]
MDNTWYDLAKIGRNGLSTNYSVIGSNGTTFEHMDLCYEQSRITPGGRWDMGTPLDYSLPLFALQLVLVVLVTRIVMFLLKPLRQPGIIAEIIGGIILGPSGMGQFAWFANTVYPIRGVQVVENVANVGLLFFLFLVGLEMDLSVVRRAGKKSFIVAAAGMALPFVILTIGAPLVRLFSKKGSGAHTIFDQNLGHILFYGAALSVTAFSVLARIIVELKLLTSELGRLAMASAIVNDTLAWIILAVGIAITQNEHHHVPTIGALYVILSSVVFVGFCVFIIRPGIEWIIRNTPEGESVSDLYICLILTGVMFCGFVTDSIGTHSTLGAFLFGLVIPNGPLASDLIEKLEAFVSGMLLPFFFTVTGWRTNVRSLTQNPARVLTLIIAIILCSLAKIGATYLAAVYYEMPASESIALGLLMNTKGLNELVVLNVGRDKMVFDDRSFTSLVIMAVLTTAIIIPIVTAVYRPGGRFVLNWRRTLQKSNPDADLRLLTCIHSPRNVPTIIRLLDISYPNKRSHIYVYALQLVELAGRASAMLIVHNTRKSGRPAMMNRTRPKSDQIVNAFENYQQNAASVTAQHLTAISPYSTMHEDICNLAEDKRVSLIIVPFHKQPTIDGGMEEPNPAFRTVNQNVLANAPCSVGILVDRGLGASSRATNSHSGHHVVLLFFGGPDDREALSYALRMSDNPSVSLKVHRFIPGEEASGWSRRHDNDSTDNDMLSIVTDTDRERQMDEDIINDFRMKTSNNESVVYLEKVTNNGEETISAIRSLDNVQDLYIVGRGQGITSPLTDGLTDWSECPELGVIGDLLASADFATSVVSVLVVQQYVGLGLHGDEVSSTESPITHPSPRAFEQQPSRGGPTNNFGNGNRPWQKVYRH